MKDEWPWRRAPQQALLLLSALCMICIFDQAHSQNQTQPTTDPSEVSILNSIFKKWGLSGQMKGWNTSGEPCTGVAIDNDKTTFDNQNYNPLIKCDCSYDNGTTCHIVALKVEALSVPGPIPDELWNLTYLVSLSLDKNVLSGSLSPSIGNLIRMKWLSLSVNSLSGEVPKELGKLTELLSLSFGINNFSGPLPSELGSLTKLEQIYIDSSGVSGPIPPTFANLQHLQRVWAADNELNGMIPEFIGNWTDLQQLVLNGNSFEGPIPSTFSNLASLQDLRLSGLSSGSSSLEIFRDFKNLAILILRNNNISGSIPSSIGEIPSLLQLDLSFNNLNGQIPDALFNSRSLQFLFLGNNNLNGTLPTQKSSSLFSIDLSYNFLSGSFPTWVNNQNLKLNLVGNNFIIDNSNSSVLPSGLKCLQRNFPCNRVSPKYSSFAVNCGGPEITSSTNVVYERDNDTLSHATYFVSDRWGVSNVGYFSTNNDTRYSSTSQLTNTLDRELYKTGRISASSLRYYGLGLENGNYSVTLQFAETTILDSSTWQRLGRRVFDIYVQGNLIAKDFDIRKEAGSSFKALTRTYNASVTENYLEVHLFWAGKGTCCVPKPDSYGPMISAISATPDFKPTIKNSPPTNKKDQTGMIIGITIGVGAGCLLAMLLIGWIVRTKNMKKSDNDEGNSYYKHPFII